MNGYGPLTKKRMAQLHDDCAKNLNLDALPVGAVIEANTRNSKYLIRIEGPKGRVSVKGSLRFPDWTRVIFNGSTWGGSMIHVGRIGYGMNMEIIRPGVGPITTTPVESFRIVENGA